MDYIESSCCFDASAYTGTPDTAPCPRSVDIPALIARLDALYAKGQEHMAGQLLDGEAKKPAAWVTGAASCHYSARYAVTAAALRRRKRLLRPLGAYTKS